MTEPSNLVLSPEEIYDITHYKLPAKQLVALQEMGIPAYFRKADHTVCVLRAHVTNPDAPVVLDAPGALREGSVRPELKSSRRLQKIAADFTESSRRMKRRVEPS